MNNKIEFDLVGQDGNPIALVGAWTRAARRQGWSDEDIEAVRAEALSSDYDHVIQTIMEHSE